MPRLIGGNSDVNGTLRLHHVRAYRLHSELWSGGGTKMVITVNSKPYETRTQDTHLPITDH
jgi:hypothetical protein